MPIRRDPYCNRAHLAPQTRRAYHTKGGATMGSAALGALIAHAAFWVLLVRGWLGGELGTTAASVFLALWLLALAVASQLPYLPFASVVALLDVVLVLIV